MEDFTVEVGLKKVTGVLGSTWVPYPGIGHKIFLRSKSSHIFSCTFDVPDDLQGTYKEDKVGGEWKIYLLVSF